MKKGLSAAFAALFALSLLVSCGGDPVDTADPRTSTELTPPSTTPGDTGSDPVTTPPETEPPVTQAPDTSYVWSEPVPEGESKTLSYFDDAVFLGDSRIQGFYMSSGVINAEYIYAQGFQVNQFSTAANVMGKNGELVTAKDALAALNGNFGKVYIGVGLNELGWESYNFFYTKVCEIIDAVREQQPDAIVYVLAVTPVTQRNASGIAWHSLEKIDLFNNKLKQAAEDKKAFYVDWDMPLRGSDRYLREDLSAVDGAHFTQEGYQTLRDYLLAHTADLYFSNGGREG